MFGVHGPDVTIKQTRGIWYLVVSWAAHTGLAERLLHNSKAAKAGCSGRSVRVWVFNLPPPLFAYFVWNGNKIALVQYVDQRSAGTHKQNWKYYTFYKLTEWDESTSHSCVECTSTSPRVLGREQTLQTGFSLIAVKAFHFQFTCLLVKQEEIVKVLTKCTGVTTILL